MLKTSGLSVDYVSLHGLLLLVGLHLTKVAAWALCDMQMSSLCAALFCLID